MIAEVIVDISNSEIDRVFDYKVGNLEISVGSRVTVPFGRFFTCGIVIGLKNESDIDETKLKSVASVLDKLPALTKECVELSNFVKSRYHVTYAQSLRLFLPSEMRTGKVKDKITRYAEIISGETVDGIISKLRKGSTARINAVNYLFQNGKTSITKLNEKFGSGAINGLIEKGFLTVTEEKLERTPYKNVELNDKVVTLSKEQEEAVKSFLSSDKTTHLLHGVTGSGKTEVYLRLINSVVKQGKTAIMLVPEIALTPQMLIRLRARFGDMVSILHSGLSAGERFDEWWRLRTGQARIAIGARSAIFAPVENLGLIVIDEEHDQSYESESSPRYKTLELANFRAKYNNCKIILGSATPKVSSYKKALDGEYNLIEMNTRINKRTLPEVTVADMRRELKRGNNSVFSRVLLDELSECLSSGNQAIIFLNRRGYSKQIICKDCGYVPKCKDCDVTLTYHQVGNLLKCHYCGATYKMPSGCVECGSTDIGFIGTGTQKVVEELGKLFPNAKILRMDNDTTQNKEGHFKILKEFSERKADILVGTQMIAKGHDFPFVTLVGILDADMSLYFSDYQSGERTFELITQVAGRSGRAENVGKVVMQTYSPENSVLNFATKYDYKSFYKKEILMREMTNFPPFATLVRIMVEAQKDEDAITGLKNVFESVEKIYVENKEKFIFFNKMKCPIKRLQDKYRYEIIMRIKGEDGKLLQLVYDAVDSSEKKNCLIYVEENPSSML